MPDCALPCDRAHPRKLLPAGYARGLLNPGRHLWCLSLLEGPDLDVAAAVGPELTYVKVLQGDQILYLSKGTLHMLRGDYQVLAELKGRDMEGWTYDGPFDDLPAAQKIGGVTHLSELLKGIETYAANAHRVILWDEVGESEGTGIVHIAPGCGAEDFQLGRE